MARRQALFEDVLKFASTARVRSTVYWAAVAFAACHLIAILTIAPIPAAEEIPGDLRLQLIHFCAVLCRFVLPLGVLGAGLLTHAKSKRVPGLDLRSR